MGRHYKSNSVHRCHAKGPTGARPYAFTVNQEHVLFYVCHEDARLTQAQLADFDVRPAPAGNPHWQLVKLYTVNDVLRLGRHFKKEGERDRSTAR